jgi:hypothetical protein
MDHQPKAPKKKKPGGRKSRKVRQHLSLSPNLAKAASVFGAMTFGNTTAYIEHLILKAIEDNGNTVHDIDRLAEEWDRKQREREAGGKP